MTCQELRDSYELYALGLADGPERTEVAEHLGRNCEQCVPGVSRARALNASVLVMAADANPPARLRGRILASVGAEPARGWVWGWAAVAAALAVAAVIFMMQARQASRETDVAKLELRRDHSRIEQVLQFLQQPDTEEVKFGTGANQPPRGRVILNPSRGVLLIASNLPPTSEGRTYEMWLLPKTGGPRPAGLFQSAASGTAMHFQPGPVDRLQTVGVAVSIEPAAGSLAPTTTPIIVAKL